MLGQPLYMLAPEVIGVRLTGALPEGATATDLVLTVTQMPAQARRGRQVRRVLRPGLAQLSLPDRATIANMAPEYGATIGFFPVDDETLRYLRLTGRSRGSRRPGRTLLQGAGPVPHGRDPRPGVQRSRRARLSTRSRPAWPVPSGPQDRVPLAAAANRLPPHAYGARQRRRIRRCRRRRPTGAAPSAPMARRPRSGTAQWSSRPSPRAPTPPIPSVMIAAGLLATKRGRARPAGPSRTSRPAWRPGSRVVTDYLDQAGLARAPGRARLQRRRLRLHDVHRQQRPAARRRSRKAIGEGDLVAAAVLSGNRNFEGRVNPHVRANYLASPPLVVAYALAGTIDIDLTSEPLGTGADGQPVYLRDIWPSRRRCRPSIERPSRRTCSARSYAECLQRQRGLERDPGHARRVSYAWDPASTYIQEPPFFDRPDAGGPRPIGDILRARVLALLGDSVTTDHISPAGSIPADGPAGRYLIDHGVEPRDFNSYRRPARQRSRHDARHVRQYPPQEPARAGGRRRA